MAAVAATPARAATTFRGGAVATRGAGGKNKEKGGGGRVWGLGFRVQGWLSSVHIPSQAKARVIFCLRGMERCSTGGPEKKIKK